MQTDRMAKEEIYADKNATKRTWHTPELRKNTIKEDTQLYPGSGNDGSIQGSSLG